MTPQGIELADVLRPFWEALLLLLLIIALTRLVGLRTFSKMSAYDFAVTVAFGSTLATAVTSRAPDVAYTALAFLGLFFAQWAVGAVRARLPASQGPLDNSPILLVHDGEVLDDNLRIARITRQDLRAKLRESGVGNLDSVRMMVFETTGSVSVITGERMPDPELFETVRGVPPDMDPDTRRRPGRRPAQPSRSA